MPGLPPGPAGPLPAPAIRVGSTPHGTT